MLKKIKAIELELKKIDQIEIMDWVFYDQRFWRVLTIEKTFFKKKPKVKLINIIKSRLPYYQIKTVYFDSPDDTIEIPWISNNLYKKDKKMDLDSFITFIKENFSEKEIKDFLDGKKV